MESSVEALKRPTLRCIEAGLTDPKAMRVRLAKELSLDPTDLDRRLKSGVARFVNNHAWALVRLQAEGLICKTSDATYALTEKGRARLAGHPTEFLAVPEPADGAMPQWARVLIRRANQRNGPDGPRFSDADLMFLWSQCNGRCAVTGKQFSNEKIGTGRAKRALAPSLDKIDPDGYYTSKNCRLVAVAVNFAINSWGLEFYLSLARSAVEWADMSSDR